MVMVADDDAVHALENGATQGQIYFMSGADPIFPSLNIMSSSHKAKLWSENSPFAKVATLVQSPSFRRR